MREVVLDTETTGLNVKEGHKIIEIGCVELIDKQLTGNFYHQYIKPNRLIDPSAEKVHGISNEFLEDKPLFRDVMDDFVDFLADSSLVIHNARFDMGFINHELLQESKASLVNKVVDTLDIARKKFPGQKVNLDALCKKLAVDNSMRDKHGALLDAEILSMVYLKMTEAEQSGFDLQSVKKKLDKVNNKNFNQVNFPKREFPITSRELSDHQEMLKKLKDHKW